MILLAIVLGATGLGHLLERSLWSRPENVREPLAVLQAALLGLVGRILASGSRWRVVAAAVALGLLAVYLAVHGRGVLTVLLAAAFVSLLLLVTFDPDRPTRGLITVLDTPLTDLRYSMDRPPAASPR